MTIASRSFIIPVYNQTMVVEQIEKLNKRAKKLGLDPITISWGKVFSDIQNNVLLPCDLVGPTSISYDGWDFIATVQHLPTGENIIRAITNDADIPVQYRTAGSDCEHCFSKRYRKDTYIVRHAVNGYRQVGSSCIKDFLGGNSPDNILQKASFIGELISFMNGAGHIDTSRNEGIYHIVTFLAHTSAVIQKYGWLSKAKAYEQGGTATAIRVEDNLESRQIIPSVEDKALAQQAAEWAENLSDQETEAEDYLHNIRALARSGMVGKRTCGFAASIISAYERAHRAPKVSNYVGNLKSRENFELVLNKHLSFDGDYGIAHKFLFTDANGNIIIWSTNSPPNLEVGKRYGIRGTIKSHNEYKGTKQTYITRCEVVTQFGE